MKPLHDYSRYECLRGKSGIYKFENTKTGKCYIGRSKNVFMRMCEHFRHSANDNDANLNSDFYKALRSSKFEDWTVELIYEISDISEMLEKETYFIKKFDSVANGYNSTDRAYGGPINRGEEHGNALLTNDDVFDIREKYRMVCDPKEVYKEYADRVAYPTFINIWRGSTWRSIHSDVYTKESHKAHRVAGNRRKAYTDVRFKKTRECVLKIRELYAEEKLSPNEVYEQFSFLNRNTFNDIWHGKTFTKLMPDKYKEVHNRGRKYIRVGNNKGAKKHD